MILKKYIPAIIVDVKEHSAYTGEIQTGIPFFGEDEAEDTGKSGPIVEWYIYETDKNGGNINENLNKFNRNGSIIIYRDEVMK